MGELFIIRLIPRGDASWMRNAVLTVIIPNSEFPPNDASWMRNAVRTVIIQNSEFRISPVRRVGCFYAKRRCAFDV